VRRVSDPGKFTRPEKLFAMGRSAGGLLMGAISNMRPDLFRGIVAEVPFVDVVTTMLDSSIPLTTGRIRRMGDPNQKHSTITCCHTRLMTMSGIKIIPRCWFTAGLHDSQVQYWEPAKWVAKLRELKTDKNRVLLKTNMEAGHGGASAVFGVTRKPRSPTSFSSTLQESRDSVYCVFARMSRPNDLLHSNDITNRSSLCGSAQLSALIIGQILEFFFAAQASSRSFSVFS
jgi:oligopeptidase B